MARDFPGSSGNRLRVPDNGPTDIVGSQLTIHVWALLDSDSTEVLVCKDAGATGQTIQYVLQASGTQFDGYIGNDGTNVDHVQGVTNPTVNVWYPVGLVKNGFGTGALRLFVNGALDATNTSNRSLASMSADVLFGGRAVTDSPLNGALAEVAIWDIALSDAEMAALGRGASPLQFRRDHLKGYWPLYGVAYPEPDLSGNGGHATQVGTVGQRAHAPVGRFAPAKG